MSATAVPAVAPVMAPVVDWTTGAGRRLLSSFSQAVNLALRRYYPSAVRGGSKYKVAAVRTKVNATAATGNATNQQWRGGGGRSMPGAAKGEPSLPAFYRAQGRSHLLPAVCFAAAPFLGMNSPLQAALLREMEWARHMKPQAPNQQMEASCFSSRFLEKSQVVESEPEMDERAEVERRRRAKRKQLHEEPLWRFVHMSCPPVRKRQQAVAARPYVGSTSHAASAGASKRRLQRNLLAYAKLGISK